MKERQQKLPGAGPEREALRQKGQFWTPDWVAEAMVAYVLSGGSDSLFDPAVGAGAFFRAAKTLAADRKLKLMGTEIDPDVLREACRNGLSEDDLARVWIGDFVLDPPKGSFEAIIANPPYIRHHRLSGPTKTKLREFGAKALGKALDGRAGLHIYFLLRALELLSTNGRLAFIMPADTCEGIFSTALWAWISHNYRLEAVVTFAPEASPFPRVDTNPVVFMIRNAEPKEHFLWARCAEAETNRLKKWVLSGFREAGSEKLAVHRRQLVEGLATGLSRVPVEGKSDAPTLLDFARVSRGIATGANEFFFLTTRQAYELGIPEEFLVPAIGRTRDVYGDEINAETLRLLESRNRPTLLFSPDARPIDDFPGPVREYLEQGREQGLHERPLISMRRPWYRMEVRSAPPVLFAYLGRRNTRFIRNLAGVVPLTGFLCVYPRSEDPTFVHRLWTVLRHPDTVANLPLVGKSYGDGAIKAEPRALERLPLPAHLVSEAKLQAPQEAQLELFSL